MLALIEAGVEIEATDGVNQTALHLAALYGNEECLNLLLEKGANKQARDKNGRSPLHIATLKGHANCIQALIDAGVEIETTDGTNQTALHLAVLYGNVECLNLLLEKGADKQAQDNHGYSPLHSATWKGHANCILALIEVDVEIEATEGTNQTALHLAAFYGNVECLNLLLEKGANKQARDNYGSSPLHIAAERGHANCVRALLAANANDENLNSSGQRPIFLAAVAGHEECLRALLPIDKKSLDFTGSDETTALEACTRAGHAGCLKILLDAGADHHTALHEAVARRERECVRVLLDHGVTRTNKNAKGKTPLMVAVAEGLREYVYLFLQKETPNQLMNVKNEVLKVAIENSQWDIVAVYYRDCQVGLNETVTFTLRDQNYILPAEFFQSSNTLVELAKNFIDENSIPLPESISPVAWQMILEHVPTIVELFHIKKLAGDRIIATTGSYYKNLVEKAIKDYTTRYSLEELKEFFLAAMVLDINFLQNVATDVYREAFSKSIMDSVPHIPSGIRAEFLSEVGRKLIELVRVLPK